MRERPHTAGVVRSRGGKESERERGVTVTAEPPCVRLPTGCGVSPLTGDLGDAGEAMTQTYGRIDDSTGVLVKLLLLID